MKREVGLTNSRGEDLPYPRQPQGKGMRWNVTRETGVFARLFLDGEAWHDATSGVHVQAGVLEIDWSKNDDQPTRYVNNGHELWDSSAVSDFERAVENHSGDVNAFNDAMQEFIDSDDFAAASIVSSPVDEGDLPERESHPERWAIRRSNEPDRDFEAGPDLKFASYDDAGLLRETEVSVPRNKFTLIEPTKHSVWARLVGLFSRRK